MHMLETDTNSRIGLMLYAELIRNEAGEEKLMWDGYKEKSSKLQSQPPWLLWATLKDSGF